MHNQKQWLCLEAAALHLGIGCSPRLESALSRGLAGKAQMLSIHIDIRSYENFFLLGDFFSSGAWHHGVFCYNFFSQYILPVYNDSIYCRELIHVHNTS